MIYSIINAEEMEGMAVAAMWIFIDDVYRGRGEVGRPVDHHFIKTDAPSK